MNELTDRLRRDAALDPETRIAVHDLAYLADAADEIDRLRKTLSWIAHCDTPGHPDFEPHLYRSMMMQLAAKALGE